MMRDEQDDYELLQHTYQQGIKVGAVTACLAIGIVFVICIAFTYAMPR